MLSRPTRDEASSYYFIYIDQVPEGDLSVILSEQMKETVSLLSSLEENQGDDRYAPDKWTVKEVLGHIIETERIMSYRVLSFARGEQAQLFGFDQEAYVKAARFHERNLSDLLEEFTAVRQATLTLLRGVPQEAWTNTGNLGNAKVSARAIAYVLTGHEKHHVQVLKEKYLSV
ncbi:DinB family protein [Brevibacillus reuszeri]|uniref:DinB family protein n=1 Tax=Brevibacillus reuszeri TaxID=54915 RepID=UPI003D208369